MPESLTGPLQPYFTEGDLHRTRIAVADPLPISVPPFVGTVKRLGFDFPDVRLVPGITFDDVIGLQEPPAVDLLFHELVHVVQFRLLGVDEFARRYVRGFLQARAYDRIPLERCAYNLETRFNLGMESSVSRTKCVDGSTAGASDHLGHHLVGPSEFNSLHSRLSIASGISLFRELLPYPRS